MFAIESSVATRRESQINVIPAINRRATLNLRYAAGSAPPVMSASPLGFRRKLLGREAAPRVRDPGNP